MEIRKIKQLAKLLQTEGLDELELQDGDSYLKLKRGKVGKSTGQMATAPAAAEETPAKPEIKGGEIISSPLSGTFYRCKAPGVPPFVTVNDDVVQGQTLCILEAMKLMNELEAFTDCTILEILVEDAQSVSEGQALFRVLPK